MAVHEEGGHLAMAQGTNGGSSSGSIPLGQASGVPQVRQQPRAVHLEELLCGLQVNQGAVQGLLEVGILCLGSVLEQKGGVRTEECNIPDAGNWNHIGVTLRPLVCRL